MSSAPKQDIDDNTSVETGTTYQDDDHHERGNQSCGRGIVNDFKSTTGTYWKQEITNFQQKTVAVTLFMFFAAISPAITFGAIYEKSTGHWIGAVEMIVATAWVGITYALIGGVPVLIYGGTGPVLAFSAVLYKLSETIDVPFLPFNAWVGVWVMIYNIMAGFFDLNRLILCATRFTDEVFAMLISLIFIINAFGNPFSPVGLYYYFEKSHSSHEEHINDPEYSYTTVAFLSLILTLGTTGTALWLKGIRFSSFLCNQWSRSTIADFATTIAIFLFAALDHGLFGNIKTEKLNVPDKFAPTFACCDASCDKYWPEYCPDLAEPHGRRPWVVNLSDLNGKSWVPFFAAVPAALAFILVFLDDGITLHLITHPSHKLTHGHSYNYNSLLVGIMIGVNSFFGLPWLVAATVRSLAHLHALGNKDSSGKFISVLETRLTALFVHILILCSIFALPVLKLIPVPVLYGIFLYMGVTSLSTNQFWGRFLMLFMQPSRYPKTVFTEHMEASKIHKYTFIQLFLFVLLYAIKSMKSISIAFPVIIAICIPIRLYLLPKWFEPHELIILDADDREIEEWLQDTQVQVEIETPEVAEE